MTPDLQCMDCRNREGRRCAVFGLIPAEYLTSVQANPCPERDPFEESYGVPVAGPSEPS